MTFLFLSSGLFLGWSLGANDAANVFGTAVGTKMLRFKTAALIAGVFVIIGAVWGGGGTTHTLGKLGAVNALAGSFTVALAAAFTVFWMTRLRLPVSTSQAIVGAIIGWNLFTSSITDYNSLITIVSTWIICPVLAAVFAMLLYTLVRFYLNRSRQHILRIDMRTRIGLILVGAFGAYSLGANNIANVMGVFVPASPFKEMSVLGLFTLSGSQILFLIGGLAIAVGIFTYSHKVMETVGGSLLRLSPMAALVVVLSEALVLFLFSSEALEQWLLNHGLPAIPLVPVSSSQAVVGAVIGIGLLKGGRGIRYRVLSEIAAGWASTPLVAGVITFVALFFVQNVFDQKISERTEYRLSEPVITYLQSQGITDENLGNWTERTFINPLRLQSRLRKTTQLDAAQIHKVIESARITPLYMAAGIFEKDLDKEWFTSAQWQALQMTIAKTYTYEWQLFEDLQAQSAEWKFKEDTRLNKSYNKELREKRDYLVMMFRVKPAPDEDEM
jgi:inorganic phosphate transporter, PiT family